MKIQFGEYTLIPGQTAKDRWDVLRRKDIVMKDTPMMRNKYGDAKEGTIVGEKDEEIAYDMLLQNAIEKIISYSLADKEETTDLKGFLFEYKKQIANLESLLK